ncbi:MAG: ComEC/Rec2 family competence protein [Defluviitaleaceae bacterium]|nr:ComEC/Rec2 family competence protein [Defluviitaleaceae bacterium]
MNSPAIGINRPILWALGFLICGIAIGSVDGLSSLAAGLVLAAGLFLCTVLYRIYRYKPVFVFVLFLLLGMWRTGHSLHNHTTEAFHTEFTGVVLDLGYTAGQNQRVMLRGIHPETGANVRIMAFIRPFQPNLRLGQEATLTGELRPLGTPTNPGGYSQFQHLRSQKIDSVMWPEAVSPGEVHRTFMVRLREFRDRMAAVYDELLPPREAAVIKSMILGDRLDMDRELADLYRIMGIFHILSISGLHITILMVAANKLMGLFMEERRAGLLVLVTMVLYCLLTGAAVATVRAVTMGGVLVAAKILHREYDLLASVAWACVVLLIYEPLYLFNAGFQLSFGAVFGMGVLTTPIERFFMKIKKFLPPTPMSKKFNIALRKELAVGIAAVVSTYIIFAFHFYEIPLYSVLGNLVIMPTATMILVLGIVVGLVGLVWMPAALILSGAVYYILRFYELAARLFSTLPFAMIQTGGGSIIIAGLGAVVLVLFAYTFHGYGADFRRRGILLLLAGMVLIGAVFFRAHPMGLHVTVLDTHGNYIVMRHRTDVLVVGTARGGEDALLRYLDRHGVRNASLILTEPPRPQDGARLTRLAERFNTIYLPGHFMIILPQALTDMAENSPEIIFLHDGDMRITGRVEKQITALERGRLGLLINFRSISIAITETPAPLDSPTLTIQNSYVITPAATYSTNYHGAVLMQTNGRTIRLRTMRP